MNRHHRKAVLLLAGTAVLAVTIGTAVGQATHTGPLHGIYCTTGFATTAGCDIQLRGRLQYALGELSMLLMAPLFAAIFAFITAGIMADHVDERIGNG